MQTQIEIQNTAINNKAGTNANRTTAATSTTTPPVPPTTNPTAKRLARMPHVIHLPDETPPPRELKRLVEARIAELESEQRRLDLREEDQAFEAAANKSILSILRQHLAELRADFPEIDTPFAPPSPLPSISPIRPMRPISPTSSSIPTAAENLTDNPKNNSAQTREKTEKPVDQQRSPGDNEVRTSDNEVRKGEKIPNSSDGASPNHDEQTDGEDDDEEQEDHERSDEDEEQDDIDIADYLFDESLDAALDLKEYLSGRSPLDKLEPRIQEAILRLMEDHEPEHVAEVIAEPSPIGLGVKTSQASLYRFRKRHRAASEQARKTKHAKAVEDLLAKANDSDEAFQSAVQCVLKARLLATAGEPNADLQTIDSLVTTLNKLRKQTLAERKQTFTEKTKCAE